MCHAKEKGEIEYTLLSKGVHRKSQIHKFADFSNLLDLRTFRKCGTLRISDLWNQSFFLICGFVICGFAVSVLKLFLQIKKFRTSPNT
jgi:hypothetical protein